jgi:hypothetical protein
MLKITSPDTMQILGAVPDWQKGIEVQFKAQTSIVESLSGREFRSAHFHRPLLTLNFSAINLERILSGYFRRVFETRGQRPIGVPVWADAAHLHGLTPKESKTIICEARNRLFPWFRYVIIWSGPFTYELNSIESIGEGVVTLGRRTLQEYKPGSVLVPLAYGALSIPESVYKTPTVSTIPITFNEQPGLNSFGAASSKTGTSTIGEIEGWLNSQPGAALNQNYNVFSAQPNFTTDLKHGAVDDLSFQPISGGVATPYIAYQFNRRTLKFDYTVDRYGLQYILRHHTHHDGCCGSFWVPTWTADFAVAETAEAGATRFKVRPSGIEQMPDRYRAFFVILDGGLHLIKAQGAVRAGCGENILLDAPLPFTLPKDTPVSGAVHCRFRQDTLAVRCIHPSTAFTVQGDFIEVEDTPDLISTQKIAYLYRIQCGYETTLWANWHGAIKARATVYGEDAIHVFRGGDIIHGGIENAEDMLAEEISVTLNGAARVFVLRNRAASAEIEIYRVDMSDYDEGAPPVAESIFCGAVMDRRVESRGSTELVLSSQLRIFRREVGRVKLQRQCNHILYSAPCGLDKTTFTFEGAPIALDGHNAEVDISGQNAQDDGYFSGALILQGVRRHIVLSDTKLSDKRAFVTDIPLRDAEFSVTLWCDKSITDCGAKFNNTNNFGGCPWLPNNNPLDLVRNDSSGGKK